MTLEQLRIFVAVAEHAHVTRAARALNLTQSTVSAAIAALEARHGVALFHRVGRGIELAETGRIFLEEARAVLARAAAAEQALADLAGNPRGRLRIHASQTVANYWLPARLIGFMADFPAVTVEIAIGNTAEVAVSAAQRPFPPGGKAASNERRHHHERDVRQAQKNTFRLVVEGPHSCTYEKDQNPCSAAATHPVDKLHLVHRHRRGD